MKKALFSALFNVSFFLIFIIISFIASCDDENAIKDIDKREIPSQNVSYNYHIQPVLNVKCAYSGCHSDESRAGGISLTTYANTMEKSWVVIPFYPENSRLVQINYPGSGHPEFFTRLTQNQLEGIKTWIREGAKNN